MISLCSADIVFMLNNYTSVLFLQKSAIDMIFESYIVALDKISILNYFLESCFSTHKVQYQNYTISIFIYFIQYSYAVVS